MYLIFCMMIVVLYTVAVIYKLFRHHQQLEKMPGMMVVMIGSMFSSMTFGVIIGVALRDFGLATIGGILFGLLAGIILGMKLGLLGILEGTGAGIMGGIMGAMVGDMLPVTSFLLVVNFMIVLFLVAVSFIFYFINNEIGKGNKRFISIPQLVSTVAIMALLLVFSTYSHEIRPTFPVEQIEHHQLHH